MGFAADMPWRSLRQISRATLRKADLTVDGLAHVPATGPAIIVARHYHHLFDGASLLATLPRPLHPIVAMDWVEGGAMSAIMPRLCAAARWPAVYRTDALGATAREVADPVARRALRRAITDSVDLLREGRLVLIFPEGYPTIDPNETPKRGQDDFLPFQPGVVRIAGMASRQIGAPVPLIPAGFGYRQMGERWRIALRFGAPLALADAADRDATLARLEADVRALSTAP